MKKKQKAKINRQKKNKKKKLSSFVRIIGLIAIFTAIYFGVKVYAPEDAFNGFNHIKLTNEERAVNNRKKEIFGESIDQVIDKTKKELDKIENMSVHTKGLEVFEYDMFSGELRLETKEKDETEVKYFYKNPSDYGYKKVSQKESATEDLVTKANEYYFLEDEHISLYSYDKQEKVWVHQKERINENTPIALSHGQMVNTVLNEVGHLFVYGDDYVDVNGKKGIPLILNAKNEVVMAIIDLYDIPVGLFITHGINYGELVRSMEIPYTIIVDAETYLPLLVEYDATSALQEVSAAVEKSSQGKKAGEKSSEVYQMINQIEFISFADDKKETLPKDAKDNYISYEEYIKLIAEKEEE